MPLKRALLYITGITLLGGMAFYLGWEEIKGVLVTTSPLGLAGLCFLQVVTLSMIVYQGYYLLKKLYGEVAYSQVFSIFMAGSFIESVTPSVKFGGEAARVYFFRRHTPLNYRELTGVLLLHKYVSILPFLLVALLFLGAYPLNFSLTPGLYIPLFFAGLFLALLFVLAVRGPGDLLKRFKGVGSFLEEASRHSREMVTSGERRWLLFLSLLIWGIYPLKVYGAAHLMGLEVDFILIGVATFTAYLVSMVPLLPGGLGTYEGTMVLILSSQGIDPAKGLALVLLSRFVTYWFPLLMGGMSALYLAWLDKRKFAPGVKLRET